MSALERTPNGSKRILDYWAVQLIFGISPDPIKRASDLGRVYVGLIAGIVMVCISGGMTALGERAGLPDRSALIEASGTLHDATNHKGTIYFRLVEHSDKFVYPSKAGASSIVFREIHPSVPMKLWHEAPADGYEKGRTTLNVFQIEIAGHMLRSYDEVKQNWLNDNRLWPWLAAGFLLCVLYLFAYVWLAKRYPA